MEVPHLSVSCIWCLDDHVSVVDQVEISVRSHLSGNVEWSFNIETEVLIEFSLYWFLWIFIGIDDVKLLIDLTVLVPNNHLSLLSIDSSMYIHNLSFLVHNVWSLESEELPPS